MATTLPAPSARDRILDAARDLVLRQGFGSTTVQQVLDAAGASKGAFFHHFPSKDALGRELVARYAAEDAAVLERVMAAAESVSEDPAEQVVAFVGGFEQVADAILDVQPSCLFVSFIYERELTAPEVDELVVASIQRWRHRILAKLEAAMAGPGRHADVDLPSLADHVFVTFEGAFLMARATQDPSCMRTQLGHVRRYLQLLLGVDRVPEVDVELPQVDSGVV